LLIYTFHRLDPVVFSDPELTSETMNPFRHFGRTPWMGIGPSYEVCLHSTAQHKKTRKYVHVSSGIRTHDRNVRTLQVHKHIRQCGPNYVNVYIKMLSEVLLWSANISSLMSLQIEGTL